MTELLKDYSTPEAPVEVGRVVQTATTKTLTREGALTNFVFRSTGKLDLTIDTGFEPGDIIDIALITKTSTADILANNRLYGRDGTGGSIPLENLVAISGIGTHRFTCLADDKWSYVGHSPVFAEPTHVEPAEIVDVSAGDKTGPCKALNTTILNDSSSNRVYTLTGDWAEGSTLSVIIDDAGSVTLEAPDNFEHENGTTSTTMVVSRSGGSVFKFAAGAWRVLTASIPTAPIGVGSFEVTGTTHNLNRQGALTTCLVRRTDTTYITLTAGYTEGDIVDIDISHKGGGVVLYASGIYGRDGAGGASVTQFSFTNMGSHRFMYGSDNIWHYVGVTVVPKFEAHVEAFEYIDITAGNKDTPGIAAHTVVTNTGTSQRAVTLTGNWKEGALITLQKVNGGDIVLFAPRDIVDLEGVTDREFRMDEFGSITFQFMDNRWRVTSTTIGATRGGIDSVATNTLNYTATRVSNFTSITTPYGGPSIINIPVADYKDWDIIEISLMRRDSIVNVTHPSGIYGRVGTSPSPSTAFEITAMGTHRFVRYSNGRWIYVGCATVLAEEEFITPYRIVNLASGNVNEGCQASETTVVNLSGSNRIFTLSGTWKEGAKVNIHKQAGSGAITLVGTQNFQAPNGTTSTTANFSNNGSVTIQMIQGVWRIVASVSF